MAVQILQVVGGGGWNSIGAFPANQNDGDNNTYQWYPGDQGGSNDNQYDGAALPSGASISGLVVSGLWGAGSPPAITNVSAVLGVNTVALGSIGDVGSYAFAVPRPGGGVWTKADVEALVIRFSSAATGNGNAMRLKSSELAVTYILAGAMFVGLITR